MLLEFTFSNYRSYKNEVTIDFISKSINEFENSLIRANEYNLLPVCAIYGPNGGGKSGVLLAIKSLQKIIISPLIQLEFMRKKIENLSAVSIAELNVNVDTEEDTYYYKWDDESKEAPTSFSILFQTLNYKYRYELKIMPGTIVEENLYYKDEKGNLDAIFERDEDSVYLNDELKGIDIDNINESLPLLSYIGIFKNIPLIDNILKFFFNIQTVNFDSPASDRRFFIDLVEKDKKRIMNVVQSMGIDIFDIRVEYDNNEKVKEIFTVHKLENNIFKELNFKEESSGTRKIFSILPVLLYGIDMGKFFVIDELDAKLHPALLQRIIELFTNPQINKNGAQLLFTSHDISTMNNKVFRRDEIWFSSMNSYDESVLYSLVDFRKENGKKARNDEMYGKQYLEGRYGADPYLKQIINWEVEI